MSRPRRLCRWLKRREGIIQWVMLVLMLIVAVHLVEDARHQAHVNRVLIQRLNDRQNALCVAVKHGRVVFQQVINSNGLYVASKISLVDCPGVREPAARLLHR